MADGGVTWSDPRPLNNNASNDTGDDSQPQVSTDGAGNWVAVWNSYDSLGDTIGTDGGILVSKRYQLGPEAVVARSTLVTRSFLGHDLLP